MAAGSRRNSIEDAIESANTSRVAITPTKMKVAELREALSVRGLSSQGLKKDLAERLEEALEGELQESSFEESPLVQKESTNDNSSTVIISDASHSVRKKTKVKEEFSENLLSDVKKNFDHHIEKNITEIASKMSEKVAAQPERPRLDMEFDGSNMACNSQIETTFIQQASPNLNEETPSEEILRKLNDHSTVVHINNLVRPFTVSAVRDLVSQFGPIEAFWMDTNKTQSFIQYKSPDSAKSCIERLNGLCWPLDTGRALSAVGSTKESMDAAMAAKISPNLVEPVEQQPPIILDQLFKRTVTDPRLYYLPANSA